MPPGSATGSTRLLLLLTSLLEDRAGTRSGALGALSMEPRHLAGVATALLGAFNNGYVLCVIAGAIPQLTAQFSLTASASSLVVSAPSDARKTIVPSSSSSM